ncbi:zinc-ribbon domain-containing protein [Streptomyces sp. NPDC056237]|uniref:zinc-ribbon domain-containing protein n=1 Tax=unclassified Streptomyces TaxID=2593676 RepID=UPI0035D7EF07
MDEYDFQHPENPADLPFTGSVTTSQSVWWRCGRDESHQWRTSFNNRHAAGTGCPRCRLPALVSPGTVPRHASPGTGLRRLRSWRVGMLLPGHPPVAVEYDGAYWHKDAFRKDQEKATDLMASGHIVIRVRERPLPTVTPNDIVCTPEQPADAVAEQVYRKIVDLTHTAARESSDDSEPMEGMQLQLISVSIPASETAHKDVRSETQRIALHALATEALLQIHAMSVNHDLALGEHMVCGGQLDDVWRGLRQDAGWLHT